MSNGTIVGRSEPFAKVFASSRAVKRKVGVTAWAILEDIALDAHLDIEGRLVATTNVRRIADNIGVSKNTVTTHLRRLLDHGFVLHEEGRQDDTGRWTTSRYVLDPDARIERFTHTPSQTAPSPATTTQSHRDDAPPTPTPPDRTRSGQATQQPRPARRHRRA